VRREGKSDRLKRHDGGQRPRLTSRFRDGFRAFRDQGLQPPPGPAEVSIDEAIETLAAASFKEIQDRGYHFQKRDYYSAVNDLAFLADNWDLWHERPLPKDIAWDLDAQIEQVRLVAPHFEELAKVPWDPPAGPPRYYWNNDFWRGSDAPVHYGLLRRFQPRRVVEIGSGWSSLLLADALRRNEESGAPAAVVDQIEPFPRKDLLSALPDHWTLHEVILQRANLELFESLGPNDVCFYDGSHVARTGSDVAWFFFEVLPRLNPGVLVHVHDIFWPGDYPDEWIMERGQSWNEQYLLQAFLMHNERFELLICNSALYRCRKSDLLDLYAGLPDECSGVSVWLRKTGP
jgi:methyltransferase family protein